VNAIAADDQASLLAILREAQRHAPIWGEVSYDAKVVRCIRGFAALSVTVIAIDPHPLGIQVACLEGRWLFTSATGGVSTQDTHLVGTDCMHAATLELTGTVLDCNVEGAAHVIGHRITLGIKPRHPLESEDRGLDVRCPRPELERMTTLVMQTIREIGIGGDAIINGKYLGGRPGECCVSLMRCALEGDTFVLETDSAAYAWRASAVAEVRVFIHRMLVDGKWRGIASVECAASDLVGAHAGTHGHGGPAVVGIRRVLMSGY